MQVDHEDQDCVCPLCDEEFESRDWQQLADHMKEPHEQACDHCAKRFVTRAAKEKHALDVHGIVRGLDLRY
jgi:ribonuclease HI